VSTPFLTTLHGRLDLGGLDAITQQFPDAPFVSISNNQRVALPGLRYLRTIYHGLPAPLLSPVYRPGNYLAFLGRLTAEKGPEAAIRIAKNAGMPLQIAAKIPRGERRYYKERLEPLIDGTSVRLVGEVNDAAKQDFLAGASALLFPIEWPEPFGLVMIEAMACGTPVIAFNAGSVPEVIDHQVTGFVVDSEDEALTAVKRLNELDRRRVRERFDERFTATRMAKEYMACYRVLLKEESSTNSSIAAQ
jgi:glycosyltransferase involved in cell wall biosynthesis